MARGKDKQGFHCSKCNKDFNSSSDRPQCPVCRSRQTVEAVENQAQDDSIEQTEPESARPAVPKFHRSVALDPRVAEAYRYEVERHGYKGSISDYLNDRTMEAAKARGIRTAIILDSDTGQVAIPIEHGGAQMQENRQHKPDDDLKEILAQRNQSLRQEVAGLTIDDIRMDNEKKKLSLEKDKAELERIKGQYRNGGKMPQDEQKEDSELEEIQKLLGGGDLKRDAINTMLEQKRLDLEMRRLDIEKKRKEIELMDGTKNNGKKDDSSDMIEEYVPTQMPDGTMGYKLVRHRGMFMQNPFMQGMYNPMMPGMGGMNKEAELRIKQLEEKLEQNKLEEELKAIREENQQMQRAMQHQIQQREEQMRMMEKQQLMKEIEEAKAMASQRTDRYDLFKDMYADLQANGMLRGGREMSPDEMAAKTANETVNALGKMAAQKIGENDTVPHKIAGLAEHLIKKSIDDATPTREMEDYDEGDLSVMYENLRQQKSRRAA